MSTIETIPGASKRYRHTVAGAAAAVATLVATLFLIIPAARHTNGSVRTQAAYTPLIQYRGTGQPPTAGTTHTTAGAQPTTGLLRAEHSYGAVP